MNMKSDSVTPLYVLDFHIHDLSLLSGCNYGQIGYSIGPSELCFITFELPVPNKFGTLCVLPVDIFDIENILEESLSIFVFTSSVTTGMKMTDMCQIELKQKKSFSCDVPSYLVPVSMAEFQSPLHNSIGVGTLSGNVKGEIYLHRIDMISECQKTPQKVVPPLQLALLPTTDEYEDSVIEEDSLIESSKPPEPVITPNEYIIPKQSDAPITSPIIPKHTKQSRRYNLDVTEPEEIRHFIEVDDVRKSQSQVDVIELREPEDKILVDRSIVPWCLSFHYDDSHSLRVKGHNPPVPEDPKLHKQVLQLQKSGAIISQDLSGSVGSSLTVVNTIKHATIERKKSDSMQQFPISSHESNEGIYPPMPPRRHRPKPRTSRKNNARSKNNKKDTEEKLVMKGKGEDQHDSTDNIIEILRETPNVTTRTQQFHQPQVPGLKMHKFDPIGIIDEPSEAIVSYDCCSLQEKNDKRGIIDSNSHMMEQNNIRKYSENIENYMMPEDKNGPDRRCLTTENAVIIYFEK